MGCKVIGLQKGTSKKDAPYSILHITRPFDDYETKSAIGGVKSENVYLSADVPNDILGKEVEFVYGKGFQGKAYVSSVKVIK